jgi:predicted dithiol-disulfide oxidoreductase (DUF899 family)
LGTFGEGAARGRIKFRDQKSPKTHRFARPGSHVGPVATRRCLQQLFLRRPRSLFENQRVYSDEDHRRGGRQDADFTGSDAVGDRCGTVIRNSQDMFGTSVFVKDDGGTIFRGTELLMGASNWIDLAPKGRNETGGTISWVRLHDEY